MRRIYVVLLGMMLLAPVVTEAQSSIYSPLGVGFLGRPIGTRSRGAAGGLGSFDARSAINPAATGGFRRLSITGSIGTELRSYNALGASADGLRETRAPFGQLGGWLRGTPVSFSLTYYPYADRTYNLIAIDTVEIRGDSLESSDRIFSDGAVANIAGALGYTISSRFSVGAALHLITGSARAGARRNFDQPGFAAAREEAQLGFNGLGFSVGIMAALFRELTVSLAFRNDSRLETIADSVAFSRIELPKTFSGGVLVRPFPAVQWGTTVIRQTWSEAANDLEQIGGANAYDTWEVSSGFELGGIPGSTRIPLRLGFRYAQLPFSSSDQPHEVDISAGSGYDFAGGRAVFEFSAERIFRRGGGAEEDAWYLTFSVTVRP
ncbi:MAG: hypothetical protein JSW51_09960 [Gemmatimonadota bacterium]|nr:MAG: hypothetical protein JSW51_09960 [Gemmatimonadota bacterium]